jgi:hypothetical protein
MRAIVRQSGQLADQRSGTVVAVRAPERFAPNSPTLKALALCIAWRRCWAGLALDLIIASPGPRSIMLVPSITWCHLATVELVWQFPMVSATASSPLSTGSACGL